MSTYQYMDHAAWMESNNSAARKLGGSYARRVSDAPETLSEFQKRVCDIIGMVGGGIYNAPIGKRIDWQYGFDGVSVIWKHGMATFDFNELTSLVFLCHEARIRCQVEGAGPRQMRITFWQRLHDGGLSRRHPNLDEAVAAFHAYLPPDHRIIYKRPDEAQDAATAARAVEPSNP